MVLANVAAAEELERLHTPCMYRVHAPPSEEKLEALRGFLSTLGISLPPGNQLHPRDFDRVLRRYAGTPESQLISEVMLRSQSQAAYSPDNIGHFGLALPRYAHFTSPIRRYADLLVHRSLIKGSPPRARRHFRRADCELSRRSASGLPRLNGARSRPNAMPSTATSPPSWPLGSAGGLPREYQG